MQHVSPLSEFKEENNYPKAFLATGIIVAVLIALCYLIVIHAPPPEESGTGGILVNYGTTDEGMGEDYTSTEEPSVAPKANQTRPDKVTPAPPTEDKPQPDNSENKVVTQNNEDAPEVKTDEKKPANTVSTAQPTKAKPTPTVNQNALYGGAKTTAGTGAGDGTGNKPGNQGKPDGSTLTNNYDGTGSGNGGKAMPARSFVRPPSKPAVNTHNGKVVVEFRIDKNGNVIYARAGGRGTTIVDADLLEKCEQAVMNAKVSPSAGANDVQTYTQTFVFKMQ